MESRIIKLKTNVSSLGFVGDIVRADATFAQTLIAAGSAEAITDPKVPPQRAASYGTTPKRTVSPNGQGTRKMG